MRARTPRVVVVGAGIGGLVAALELAGRGFAVTICEQAAAPGGKMRQIAIGDDRIDAGPTVLTMRWVFDDIFAQAGAALSDHLDLRPMRVLARHAWSADERLDLFADADRTADAIGRFSGAAQARQYKAFCERARRIYETLDKPFIRSARPANPMALAWSVGPLGLGNLMQIGPFATMWQALGEYFPDPRLRQLFGRYATYCGSSPFSAPATLMLVAHVEREGVWSVEGGMHRVAAALADLAASRGVELRYAAAVCEIRVACGRAAGVTLATGEVVEADAVVVNADVAALAAGNFGAAVSGAAATVAPAARSLSAVTWAMIAETEGFPLVRHNVFFSPAYKAEFDAILERRTLPDDPTVYVCAQDRGDEAGDARGPERLLCLVNAPAVGDTDQFTEAEIEACAERTFARLARCGLTVKRRREATRVTDPSGFERLFPATGGALYGEASHGWAASFRRPGARSRIPGLYLAGGSVHPGPGVPMAALSGRQAAASLLSDLASTRSSRATVMSGGMSTR